MAVTRSKSRSLRATPTTQAPPPTSTSTSTSTTTTTAAETIDPATLSRTIAHMNKDHSDDMSAILQHRANLSRPEAAHAEMLGLDLTTITIRSASGVHVVPVAPPMGHWDDRRARLAEMTESARKALGTEDEEEEVVHDGGEQQKPGLVAAADAAAGATAADGATPPPAPAAKIQFYPPRGSDWLSFGGLALYYFSAALVYGGFVTPGSGAWRFLDLVGFPYGPAGFIWLVRQIIGLVLGIHVLEAFWLDRSRLAPGGLRRGTGVWWLWIGAAFFEGLPAYRRWDRHVKGKGSKSA
ncbi:hypothetical protein VPNG_06189 [Cytospora leucostoma]|uniref:DUF2470 domain-containing protein n=1 Tax=Cytospora leucostoma TaxID=1230097 RepID=A0A423WYR3_9PEZI|nr:hypothetical protein VPNG_06189 [Cytospora leucostoma]